MNKSLNYQVIIVILAIANLFLIYKLVFALADKNNHEQKNKSGFYVNGIVSGINTNANFSSNNGYTVKIGDTILIDHYLKVTNIPDIDDIEPMNYLFEFNQADSSFDLITVMPYTGNNYLDYHVVNNKTKLLFIQAMYPLNSEYISLQSFLEVRVIDSLGTLSPTISGEEIDNLYKLFRSEVMNSSKNTLH